MLLWSRLSLLRPSKRRSRELSLEDELRSHMELAADDALREGVAADEAQFAAKRDLGSVLRTREDVQTVWGFPTWDHLKQDLVYSIRTLRNVPSFSAIAVLSLGIGIGSATAIFSLVNTILLKPLAYSHPAQLLNIREIVPSLSGTYPSMPVNYEHFRFWREQSRAFESLAALQAGSVDLTGDEPMKLDIAEVSQNLFSLLGVQPQIGRAFLPEDGQKGHERVVVITNSLWARRFGRARDVVGKPIMLNYLPHTVVGVLPPSFRFPKNDEAGALIQLGKNTEIFLPLTGSYSNDWGGDYDYTVWGRLKPNVSIQQARAELDLLEHRIDVAHQLGGGLRALAQPLQDVIAEPVRGPLYVLFAAVLLLLLIVCVNLANLVLARSSARSREFSIRTALGASRTRLMQQLLIETLLLGVAGGALGLPLAVVGIHYFVASTSISIPRLDEVQVDGRVFLFSGLVSIACGVLSGILPALRMANGDSQESLRAGSHTVAGHRRALRVREILVGCEVGISVVLLFGAALMMTSLMRLLHMDKGFTAEQAVAVDIALPYTHYKSGQDYIRFWDQALERVRSIPGVRSAAFVSKLPLTGESMVNDVVLEGSEDGALDPLSRNHIEINVRYVSPDYFNTLGIPLIAGRAIEPFDRDRAVTVVSQRLARKLWPGQNAIGKKFSTGAMVGKVEVIGIVKDVHSTKLDQEPTLMTYVPYWHRGLGAGSVVIRTGADPGALIPVIRSRLHAVDPSLPAPETRTIAALVSDSLSSRYFQLRLASGFASAALVLALVGIYGVLAYSIAQRRTEIAIRMAVGGSRTDVLRLVVGRGLRPVWAGLFAGLFCAALSAQLIRSLLFGVKAADPVTMLLVFILIMTTALCACMVPAFGAMRTDPALALRYE